MNSKVWLGAVVLLLIAGSAHAEMPYYDVNVHCQRVASFGGAPSQMILNGCLQQEQAAYNTLKPQWDSIPAAIKSHCDGVARFGGGGTYMILQGCVEQEQSARRANQEFHFQR